MAALRRPAVVVPAERPHGEQRCTGRVLAAGPWPTVVVPSLAAARWPDVLDEARGLDGAGWAGWVDGHAAARLADVVQQVAR